MKVDQESFIKRLSVDQKGIIQELDQCLLDEQELLAGKAYWQTLEDPFPDWERGA